MTENIDKVGPFDKIKQAKELFDMGAITQEEYDNIKNNCLNQLHQSDKEPKMPEIPQEVSELQPGDADAIGDILGTVLAGEQSVDGKQTKKSETQKMAERASQLAANTAAREVTKSIMREIFKDMK